MNSVFFYNGHGEHAAPLSSQSGGAIPDALHMAPGHYAFKGQAYDCTVSGLYVFYDRNNGRALNRIVWRNPCDDVYGYIAAVMRCHVTGGGDNGPLSSIAWVMKNKLARLRCGEIGYVIRTWLSQFAPTIVSREARCLTADPWDSFDNGHVGFEVWIDGAWRYFDGSSGMCFRDPVSNEILSLAGIIDIGYENVIESVMAETGPTQGRTGDFDDAFNARYQPLMTAADWRAWRVQMYQIPVINNQCYLPAGTEHRAAEVQASGVAILSKSAWMGAYY